MNQIGEVFGGVIVTVICLAAIVLAAIPFIRDYEREPEEELEEETQRTPFDFDAWRNN